MLGLLAERLPQGRSTPRCGETPTSSVLLADALTLSHAQRDLLPTLRSPAAVPSVLRTWPGSKWTNQFDSGRRGHRGRISTCRGDHGREAASRGCPTAA